MGFVTYVGCGACGTGFNKRGVVGHDVCRYEKYVDDGR